MSLHNLALMNIATGGTGPIRLAGAATVSGVPYLTFAQAGAVDGETLHYSINCVRGSEVGTAPWNAITQTLGPRTVVTSTNGNAAINVSDDALVAISPLASDISFAPGGSTTQVQFNNAGVFAGDAGLTYTPSGPLTITAPTTNLAVDIESTNAVANANAATATLGRIFTGSAANPITTSVPSIGISRYESLSGNTAGGQSGTAYIDLVSNNTTTNSQGIGLSINAVQNGAGDIVGGYLFAHMSGTSNVVGYPAIARAAAYGLFVGAIANASGRSPDNVAIALNPVISNNTGIDTPYINSAPGNFAVMAQSIGANLAMAGYVTQASPSQFDAGYATNTGSVKTYAFIDGSSAVTVLRSATAHTSGVDFTGATFSGNAWASPGSSISGTGVTTASQYNIGSFVFAQNTGTTTPYNQIVDTAAQGAIILGGGGGTPDHSNYYRNTNHVFGNIGGGTVFLTLATGATGVRFNGYGAGVLTTDATGIITASAGAPAGTLTGTTLASNVVNSSLTSLGTITSLTATAINAFTLGGTISGGGNNINNVNVGVSSPGTGNFTTLTSAAHTITSASSNALAVGLNGATNPAFSVDDSTALQASGLNVKGSTAGGIVAIAVISSGTGSGLSIDAKGNGTLSLNNTGSGVVAIGDGGANTILFNNTLTYGGVTLNNAVTGTGNMVLSNSPTLTGTLTLNTTLAGSAFGSGVATFLATPSSANLASALTDELGSGKAIFSTAMPNFIEFHATGINFNSGNTDTTIPITLPTGYTRFIVQGVRIFGASQTLTTATFGVFTATSAGGTAIVASGTACTVSTATDGAAGSLQTPTVAVTTSTFTVAGFPNLYFRVQTAQGVAATGNVLINLIAIP